MAELRGTIFSQANATAVARPIYTLVVDETTGALLRSTNSTSPAYVAAASPIPLTYALVFGTANTVTLTAGAAGELQVSVAGTGSWTFQDMTVHWGTGQDVNFVANGTNLVVEAGAGAGLLLAEVGVFRVVDTTDNTKRISFVASGITAGQTRSVTMDDADVSLLLTPGNQVITDPGTGAAIPVTRSGSIAMTTGTGAETNTLALPTAVGQELSISLNVAGGGTRTITASAAINQTGNTKIALTQAADFIKLQGIRVAAALRWQVVSNDGCTLS